MDLEPPREKRRERLRRYWLSRTSLSPVTRTVAKWSCIALVPLACLFAATGALNRDFGLAFEVLIGTRSPFEGEQPWAAVPLAAMGYLLLPAVVGAVVGLVTEHWITRTIKSHEEVLSALEERLKGRDERHDV